MNETLLASLYECFEAREWDRAVEIITNNLMEDATVASQLLIQAADFQADTKVFDALLSKGADINGSDEEENGDTSLHIAVLKNSSIDSIEYLLDNGANVNAQNAYGETPLHFAIQYAPLKTTQILLTRGANVNLGNETGETPMHVAAKENSPLPLMRVLIEANADLNIKTHDGEDVIDVARRKRVDSEVFEYLFEAY